MNLQEAKGILNRYVEYRTDPGGFLEAVLANDLMSTLAHADESSRANLADIVGYVYNELPGYCWGSRREVKDWLVGPRATSHE